MVGSLPGCCARAASGQPAKLLPRNAMNSRRLMGLTPRQGSRSKYNRSGRASQQKRRPHVREGSFAPFRRCPRQVRLVGDFGHNVGLGAFLIFVAPVVTPHDARAHARVLVAKLGRARSPGNVFAVGRFLFRETECRPMRDDGAQWFLSQAEQCERQADEVRDASVRYLYTLLARQWRQLAERAAHRQAA
jgi:hypothetical protein